MPFNRVRNLGLPLLVVLAAGTPRAAGAAVFNFNTVPIPTTTPFMLTDAGITVSFSSPDGPVFFVSPTFLSTLTGNVLLDADLAAHALDIVFSQPVTQTSLLFALNTVNPSSASITLAAFMGATLVGSVTAMGAVPPGFIFPEGSINIVPGSAFTSLRVTSTATDFAIDNVNATQQPVVPEPASVLLVGVGLLKLRSRLLRSRR